MTTTIVKCSKAGCRANATHKVAATWKDGRFSELKTYGFACDDHLNDVVAEARARNEHIKLASGEVIGPVEGRPI